jgi:ankyrin repeat protein
MIELIEAVHDNNIDKIKQLLLNNSITNYYDRYGDTALTVAVRLQHIEIVKVLCTSTTKQYICLSATNDDTALSIACSCNFQEIAEILLSYGANVHKKYYNNNTALILASAMGQLEIVKLLLRYGAKTYCINSYGNTALIEACINNKIKCVDFLLSKGANANYKDNAGFIANFRNFMLSCRKYMPMTDKMFMSYVRQCRDNNGHTALILASYRGHVEVVKLLLKHNGNANNKTYEGNTALIIACKNNYVEIVKVLMQHITKIHAQQIIHHKNKKGYTAYTITDNPEILKLLGIKHISHYLEEKNYKKVFELCKLNIKYVIKLKN